MAIQTLARRAPASVLAQYTHSTFGSPMLAAGIIAGLSLPSRLSACPYASMSGCLHQYPSSFTHNSCTWQVYVSYMPGECRLLHRACAGTAAYGLTTESVAIGRADGAQGMGHRPTRLAELQVG